MYIVLAVLQFLQIRSELDREKIAIPADRTAAPFEAAASIGLPLSSVRNADVFLERARQLDPGIKAVVLLGRDGKPVLSAGTADMLANPSNASVKIASADGAKWSGETAEGFISGLSIFDTAGDTVGGIFIVYSGQENRTAAWSMIGQLMTGGLIFALLMAPVIWIALRVILPRGTRDYDEIEADIYRFEQDSWRAVASLTGTASKAPGPLAVRIGKAEVRYRDAAAGSPIPSSAEPGDTDLVEAQVKGLRGRVVMAMTAVLAVVTLLFSSLTLAAFDRAIAPTLEARTILIGELVRAEMQRTLELGIPISALGGLTPYLENALRDFPEVAEISVVDPIGTPIAKAERPEASENLRQSRLGEAVGIRAHYTELPVLVRNDVVGTIRIEGSPRFVETRLRDVVLDASVLAMATLLIGVEVALKAQKCLGWRAIFPSCSGC